MLTVDPHQRITANEIFMVTLHTALLGIAALSMRSETRSSTLHCSLPFQNDWVREQAGGEAAGWPLLTEVDKANLRMQEDWPEPVLLPEPRLPRAALPSDPDLAQTLRCSQAMRRDLDRVRRGE